MAYSTGSVACHEAYGPAVPKSVTDNATRWPNRSASAAHDVPNAAARLPPSTTMSAVPASSIRRSRSAELAGSSTALRLLALCNANGMLAPATLGSAWRAGLPAGGSIFSTSAPRSANNRLTRSDSAPPRSSTRSESSSPPLMRPAAAAPTPGRRGPRRYVQQVDEGVGVAVVGQHTQGVGDLIHWSAFGDIDPDVGVDGRRVTAGFPGRLVDRTALPIQRLDVHSSGHPHCRHPAVGARSDPFQPRRSECAQVYRRARPLHRFELDPRLGDRPARAGVLYGVRRPQCIERVQQFIQLR